MVPVHIVGASGRTGATLCRALGSAGRGFVPVVRDAGKFAALKFNERPRTADLEDADAMRTALADAEIVVSCAHARYSPAVIAAAHPSARLFFLGSTRKFTRWPDEHGNGVIAGEAAFLASGRRGAILHPTMIYGAQGENNVQRLAALLRRLPIVPLPNGGRSLVQPIHQDDLTAAILAAIDVEWHGAEAIVVAGPAPVAYRDFVLAVARAAGLPRPRIMPFPAAPMVGLAWMTRLLPFVPSIGPSEIRRLLEDKAFDIGPARTRLGFDPMPLDEGLRRTFQTGKGG